MYGAWRSVNLEVAHELGFFVVDHIMVTLNGADNIVNLSELVQFINHFLLYSPMVNFGLSLWFVFFRYTVIVPFFGRWG